MKVVRAQDKHFYTAINFPGGNNLCFEDYLCEMPDAVADELCRLNPTAFVIDRQDVPSEAKNILLIRDMGLGDVMLSTPFVRHLKSTGVNKIGYLTNKDHAPVLEGNPYIDRVWNLDDNSPKPQIGPDLDYDFSLDLSWYVENRENGGSFENRTKSFFRAANMSPPEGDLALDYYCRFEERDFAICELTNYFGSVPDKIVALVYSSSNGTRNISHGRTVAIIEALVQEGYSVIVTHHEMVNLEHLSASDKVFNATGRHTIRQTAALLSMAKCVISPDTGMYHIASALGLPIVTYFGAFPIEERLSHRGFIDLSMTQHCSIGPCRKYHCLNRTGDGNPRCIDIHPSATVAAVNRLVN